MEIIVDFSETQIITRAYFEIIIHYSIINNQQTGGSLFWNRNSNILFINNLKGIVWVMAF